jgi:hypothetical protein
MQEGANALAASSAAEFVSAVRQLRRDARLWQALAALGQHTAESKHGLDLVAGRLLEILRATLPARRRAAPAGVGTLVS